MQWEWVIDEIIHVVSDKYIIKRQWIQHECVPNHNNVNGGIN